MRTFRCEIFTEVLQLHVEITTDKHVINWLSGCTVSLLQQYTLCLPWLHLLVITYSGPSRKQSVIKLAIDREVRKYPLQLP